MFYGQNCSGRFGENRSIISVVGSKEDVNFVRLLNELKLRKIKRELNQKYFSIATELARKYSIKVSIVIVQNNKYGEWKSMLYQHPNWFGRLYGIACKKALEQIEDKVILLHMDREYDFKTLGFAADTICRLLNITRDDIYIRKEREYPTNRIIVADLFARGCFRGYDCSQFIIIKNPDIKNELKEIFRKTR
ncbi:hypothetical protein HYX00_05375 [Candidatus Woesearchaeota archaeon]|nr:hypothetical protein [Candidatus Woesearchaeota archaeon]